VDGGLGLGAKRLWGMVLYVLYNQSQLSESRSIDFALEEACMLDHPGKLFAFAYLFRWPGIVGGLGSKMIVSCIVWSLTR